MPTPSPARVHECTVVKNEPIAQDIFALRIASPELARMLEPGQFVDIAVPGNAMSLLRIPLSFAEADAEAGTIDIWYAVVGDGTERLSRMEPGATTTVLGPGGHGWTIPEGCRRALLVAGGRVSARGSVEEIYPIILRDTVAPCDLLDPDHAKEAN